MNSGFEIENVKSVESSFDKECTPSKLQANTLFTFTSELEFLLQSLNDEMISPRYCDEDIRYLRLRRNGKLIKTIYYPMKCFCDINLHRIKEHLDCYGYYGLAFTKEWGMKNGIQPIQYINPDSELRKNFTDSFSMALRLMNSAETKLEKTLKRYLLWQLMYLKPYEGKIQGRIRRNKKYKKCFMDECEWRFVPDVSATTYKQIYFDEDIKNKGNLLDFSNSMINNPLISLKFTYSDLKYIIVKTKDDFEKLIEKIETYDLELVERERLISKIIIWDVCGGDF